MAIVVYSLYMYVNFWYLILINISQPAAIFIIVCPSRYPLSPVIAVNEKLREYRSQVPDILESYKAFSERQVGLSEYTNDCTTLASICALVKSNIPSSNRGQARIITYFLWLS